jgi:hypothetical protein
LNAFDECEEENALCSGSVRTQKANDVKLSLNEEKKSHINTSVPFRIFPRYHIFIQGKRIS